MIDGALDPTSAEQRRDLDGSLSRPTVLVKRDCFGGERIVEVRLPAPVSRAAIDRWEGDKTVLWQLPRPFFRIDVPGLYLVTGIVGEPVVRFTVRLRVRDQAVEHALEGARRFEEPNGQ